MRSIAEVSFERVLAAFAGERYPLDGGASKILYFMCDAGFLERGRFGCDVSITRSAFEIRFAWNYGPHRYLPELAPHVVSWLLAESGTRGQREVRAAIGPAVIPSVKRFSAWRMPRCHVAMRAELAQVAIRMRETDAALDEPLLDPVPAPRALELPNPCRHCGRVPRHYRMLSCGSLVCVACGRSQPAFEPPATG